MKSNAQGAIEYLLIIGAAIIVVAIVILLITGVVGTTQNNDPEVAGNSLKNLQYSTTGKLITVEAYSTKDFVVDIISDNGNTVEEIFGDALVLEDINVNGNPVNPNTEINPGDTVRIINRTDTVIKYVIVGEYADPKQPTQTVETKAALGEACLVNSECEFGLSCGNGVCSEMIANGEKVPIGVRFLKNSNYFDSITNRELGGTFTRFWNDPNYTIYQKDGFLAYNISFDSRTRDICNNKNETNISNGQWYIAMSISFNNYLFLPKVSLDSNDIKDQGWDETDVYLNCVFQDQIDISNVFEDGNWSS